MSETQRMLVTGGTGSLGPELLPLLLASPRNWAITLVGRTPSPIQHERLNWKQLDLLSASSLEGPCEGMSTIFHMANLSKINPESDYKVAGLLADAALKRGVSNFFYASSIRVYGSSLGVVDENTPANPCPGDDYAASKLRVEELLRQRLAGSPVKLRILRIGHIVSEKTLDKIPRHLSLPYLLIWGNTYPHYIHVKDAAEAVAFLFESGKTLRHEIYNITREMDQERSFSRLYSGSHSQWAGWLARNCSVPGIVPYLLFRGRVEARGTRSAKILEKNLKDESWNFHASLVEPLLRQLTKAAPAK